VKDEDILTNLLSGEVSEGPWKMFLARFSNLILKVIWRFEKDYDEVMEKYLFVCGKLLENDFARLRKFRTGQDQSPLFTTWLAAVTYNLCIDAHRSRHGRKQLPRAVARLGEFDREVFRLYYWKGCPIEEIEHRTGQGNSNRGNVRESLERVGLVLSGEPASARPPVTFVSFDENVTIGPTEGDPDLEEMGLWLGQWISTLSNQEQMILRLRFWEDMTGSEIANAMNINPPQKIYPLLQSALEALREKASRTYGDQSTSRVSV